MIFSRENIMKKIILILVLLLCFATTGCTQSKGDPAQPTEPSHQAVENLFTTPDSDETPETSNPQTGYYGGVSHGFADKSHTDENGLYHIYEGGDLHIDYSISVTGNLGDAGIGIMLILDGRPQPYKTAEDDEYSYLHTFYPNADEKMIVELILVPVTGKEGYILELTAFHVLGPDYYPNEQVIGMMQTNGSVWNATQLVFQATPPAADGPAVTERVLSQTLKYADLTSNDVQGWSSEELQSKYAFSFTPDHQTDETNIYGVSAENALTMRTEVFGATAVDWSLLLYLDHEPVSILSENQMDFSTKNGQKTIIETTLDLSGFDGESILYAVLFARNWRDPAVFNDTNCTTEITSTYYLTDAENLAAMDLKYGRAGRQQGE